MEKCHNSDPGDGNRSLKKRLKESELVWVWKIFESLFEDVPPFKSCVFMLNAIAFCGVTFCISSVICDSLFFTYFRDDHELYDVYPFLRTLKLIEVN